MSHLHVLTVTVLYCSVVALGLTRACFEERTSGCKVVKVVYGNSSNNNVQVLTALDKEERRLFHDRLRYLDKRITPGVTKLAWTSPKATLDFFYKEACTYDNKELKCLLVVAALACFKDIRCV